MNQSPLVGRRDTLQKLLYILMQGWNHHGSIVFIEGSAGMGKTVLLKMLQDEVMENPELEKTIFVEGACYESIGSQSAYQPFIDILEKLTRSKGTRHKSISTLTLNILKETAPDWLQMIPVVGSALGASIRTVTVTQQWFLESRGNSSLHQPGSLAAQFVSILSKLSSRNNFLVLIIEDAHWIDDASCQLLLRLASKIQTLPLVVLLTYRADALNMPHPLKQVQRELHIKACSQTISLSGLTLDQIQSYVLKRFGSPLHPRLVPWLVHLCKGNPLFITQYLSLLEQQQVIQRIDQSYKLNGDIRLELNKWVLSGMLTHTPIPDSLEMLLEQRIERLMEEDRELLQLGSVQGDSFMSLLLAQLLTKQELDILSRLRHVIERHRIISLYVGEEWLKAKSEFYIFEHHLMQQAFYKKLGPRERVLHHHNIAQFLERLLREQDHPPRQLLLEVAYHYQQGEALLSSAQYYFYAAQSCFLDGAFVEAIELCKVARTLLKQLGGQDRLLAEVLQLIFVSAENRWKGLAEPGEDFSPMLLVREAEEAATHTGDLALLAQILYHKAYIVLISEGLTNCLQVLWAALELARQSGDPCCEVIILEELGHHTVSENLAKGLDLLYQADRRYQTMLTTEGHVHTKTHDRLLHRLQGHIGVGEFDAGNYDEADRWLSESINGIKRLTMRDDLPRMASFLGQLYIATGRFEEAEQVLRESIDVYKDDDEFLSWRGYHLGLLGKLYLEWERIDDAVDPMVKAWQNVQATGNADIGPLVKNYYAELLIHPLAHMRNPVHARQILETNVQASRTCGYHRSAIASLTLLSRLELLEGSSEAAARYSIEAVEYLHRVGIMPALRTEEVLFNHYLAMKAIHQDTEAIDYVRQAHAIIQEKVGTISDPNRRRLFLERIPLSRAIVNAFASITTQKLPPITPDAPPDSSAQPDAPDTLSSC